LLDELMGKDRNLLPADRQNRGLHFSDAEVCKYFICGFCPNELFVNTKSDLGPCTKVHDEACKQEFQSSKKKNTYPFEREFLQYLERLIDDLDRKIKKGHERLDHQEDPYQPSGENAEKIGAISSRIQLLLKQVEDLAEAGNVDESQMVMKQVDVLKTEKEQIQLLSEARSVTSQEKRMKVCDICGAFLVVGDTEKRIQSHLEGKQHQGYALIRKTLEEIRRTMPIREETAPERDIRRDNRHGRDNRRDNRNNDNRDNRNRDNKDFQNNRGQRRERDDFRDKGNKKKPRNDDY